MTPAPISRGVTRRDLLRGGSAVAIVASLGACDLSTEPDTDDPAAGGSGSGLKEAPMLAEQVEAGDLPPLEDRLPVNPLVVEPTERLGTYGGTWRTAIQGTADNPWLWRTIGYESLLRWTPSWDGIIPNIAESVEVSEDGREFMVRLREGMKWSDGQPFTTDDLVFAYESVHLNTELFPTLAARRKQRAGSLSGGERQMVPWAGR
jgi:peptide/nickel transport system substrate-binding protein